MSQFANLKSQYTLIIIRMKIITESKHSITLRVRTLISEIAFFLYVDHSLGNNNFIAIKNSFLFY